MFRFHLTVCGPAALGLTTLLACSAEEVPQDGASATAGNETTSSAGRTTDASSSTEAGSTTEATTSTSTSTTDTNPGLDLTAGAQTNGGSTDIDETGGGSDVCTVAILGDPGWYSAANFGSWIAERGPVVDRFDSNGALAAITADELAKYDVVLLDFLGPDFEVGVSPEDLAAWVNGGGSLIALSGYGDTDDALLTQNQLLLPLDLGFDTSAVLGGPVTDFVDHPITQGLTSITFVGGRRVTCLADDEVIMTINDPAIPVGVTAERGLGRAFLFGDEWITFDSEWSSIPEIQVMWINIFDWLADCELKEIIR